MAEQHARQTATLAGGCFWCTEAVYSALKGVEAVESGYIGGAVPDPSYEAVCSGTTGHAEAIRIVFDPAILSYDDLLAIFFATHDPTTLNRQGNDVCTQYRSAIFPHSPEQAAAAQRAIDRAQIDHSRPIVTAIEADAPWYPAEEYHQRYWERVGDRNPYCMATIPPKLAKLRKGFAGHIG
ncbi:MAG: peptide-methionine (S)-S-oxide reductase MsrA [Sphingobium sp.]